LFLDKITQSNQKEVVSFYLEEKFDLSNFTSNTFEIEWPPKSGKIKTFPETDEIKYIKIDEAKK